MTDLAELCLHLHDEHVKSGHVKEWMKRKITSHHVSLDLKPAIDKSAANFEDEDETAGVSTATTDMGGRNTLCNVARNLPTNGDDNDDEPVLLPSDSRIEDLFDFTNDTWAKITKEVSL